MKSNINPDTEKPWQVGEVRYPAHNGTGKWWKEKRWDLITEVDKKGNIVNCYYMWSYDTVKAVELVLVLMALKDFNEILDRVKRRLEEKK